MAQKYPVYKIQDVYHFEKYSPAVSPSVLAWSWVQMLMVLLFISYLFGNIAAIGAPAMFYYGAFIFITIYAYTELLDNNPRAFVWEILKSGFGIYLLYAQPGWFGLADKLPGAEYFIGGFFIASSAIVVWFCATLPKTTRATV